MKKCLATSAIAIAAITATAGSALGQESYIRADFPFKGPYLGANLGGVWNNTCANWTPEVAGIRVQDFIYGSCTNNDAFTGGVTLGYNIVNAGTLFGLEADYDGWSSASRTHAVHYMGTAIPTGIYNFYGASSPDGVGTVRLRLGFVSEQLMPYLTGGLAYASGSPSTRIAYTPVGLTSPTAVFSGTRTLSTSGWTVGGGFEYGLTAHFSMKVEYLYMEFGHTARHPETCGGADCTLFVTSDIGLSSSNSGKVSVAHVGFNYLFEGP